MDNAHRFHAFDNLRALMMWLGIVLHVSVQYLSGETPLPWRDSETSPLADFLFVFIHAFRMPLFFIIAGFFVAMLVCRRGYWGMLKHRFRRIGLPFVIFWPLIFIGTVVLLIIYFNITVKGYFGFDLSVMPSPQKIAAPQINTMHMWFMYYLLLLCLSTALIGFLFKKSSIQVKMVISRLWFFLAKKWWGFLVLSMPLALVNYYCHGFDISGTSFIPQAGMFIHMGVFFVFGYYLYEHQEKLQNLYSQYCWWYLSAGAVFFVITLKLREMNQLNAGQMEYFYLWDGFIYNCATWLWSFSLIGIFLRYLPNHNRILRYMAESSYSVYLIHYMWIIVFSTLLYHSPFNALTRMGLNMLGTTIFCLLTYHILVRYTFISTLLNGRRFSLKAKSVSD